MRIATFGRRVAVGILCVSRNCRQLLRRISRSKVESDAYGKTQISGKKNVSPSMPSDDAATPKKSTPPPDFKSETVFEEEKQNSK